MSTTLNKLIYPIAKWNALSFLGEERTQGKMDDLVEEKMRALSGRKMGKELGASDTRDLKKLPLTGYEFYRKYFSAPRDGDLLYPVNDYVRATTSGTMGKPKAFLLPKTGLMDNLMKTGFTVMLVSTHDGEKITFEVGDTYYRNVPGGAHISAFMTSIFENRSTGWVRQCPESDLPFQTKVDYFVNNYKRIDVAYMTVATLLEEACPRIGEPFRLKGFLTQDTSAGVLKEEIREATGGYPKTIYGSTETMYCSIPSIQHPGGFLMDWRVIYPEFIPEARRLDAEASTVDPPDTLRLSEVEAGGRYQLVATIYRNDFTRYVMPDILECVGRGDDALGTSGPVFKYYMRADRMLVLHNFTRIVEEELLQVLKAADVPFVDFTARRIQEGTFDYMELFIEVTGDMDESTIRDRVHRKLVEFDKDWRDLSAFLKYVPLRVRRLPRGSIHRFLGSQRGVPKVDRVNMRPENLDRLLSTAQSG